MSKLVIVESPAKAKTIEKYLGDDYVVRASMGHVRDLPDNASQLPEKYKKEKWAKLGVDTEDQFQAIYVVKDPRSKKSIAELKKELKNADELILATDEDREGEAISWHLVEALKPKVPIKRMVFHEITKSAIQDALSKTREIDTNLVEAQETRRILDRLVGYPLSLLVGKKIKYGLSAGRVQSPAVSLVVARERERRRFKKGSYWGIKAALENSNNPFESELHSVDGKRIANGKDFDENTGQIAAGKDVLLLDETSAKKFEEQLKDADLKVVDVTHRPYTTKPKPPFTTSTLQQDASRKLNMSASDTMAVAQRLYENGHITYMRTDSTNLSGQALEGARNAIKSLYGDDYLPAEPRVYVGKSKGAQEAHEAIRPTGDSFMHPSKSGLKGRELKLYDLIWTRTVACQMKNAKKTSIRIDLETEIEGKTLQFRANGNRIDFPGFMRAYVEGSDDPEASLDDQEVLLPEMAKDDVATCKKVEASGHETKPPARFTEASLVRKLEEEGIGRPSTYATILRKITDGRYGRLQGKAIVPTYLAFAVAEFLHNHFPDLIDLKFTARMEDDLDNIADGHASKVDYLHSFYRAEGAFKDQVEQGDQQIVPDDVKIVDLIDLDAVLKVGPYGAYAQVGEDKVNIPDDIPPADLSMSLINELVEERKKGPQSLGEHPEHNLPIFLMRGRFGPYLQLGERTDDNPKPKTGSILDSMDPDELTLETAIQLVDLPKTLGQHPEDEKDVQVGIGRYGPFVRHKKEYRSITEAEKVFTITLKEALEMLAQPKGRRSQKVLREVGEHPETKEPINVLDGRYGPYIKYQKINASLPKTMTVDELTLERAVELIEEKANKPAKPKKKKAKKKTTKKKTTAKKKPAAKKKTTAKKKAPAKKKTAAKKKTTKKKES